MRPEESPIEWLQFERPIRKSIIHGKGSGACHLAECDEQNTDAIGLKRLSSGYLMSSMTISWSLLVPGILLLFFPADRLLSSVVQLRSFDCFQSLENSTRNRPWWWVPAFWIDPLRGLSGGWLLKSGFGLDSIYWNLTSVPTYYVFLALLIFAIWLQTYTRRDDQVMLAPIGYIIGLVAVLASWPVALGGFLIGLTGLFAFRQFIGFFIMSFGAVALIGFVLGVEPMWLIPAVLSLGVPVAIAVMTGNSMELPTRDASQADQSNFR